MRDNDTKIKVHEDGNKLYHEKEWGYMPGSLDGRSISVGRQAMRQKNLCFHNFDSVTSKA